jgi:hypothetical protein
MISEEEFYEVVKNYNKEIAEYLEPHYVKIYRNQVYGCVYENKHLQINVKFIREIQSIFLTFSDYHLGSASSKKSISEEIIPIVEKKYLFQKMKEMDIRIKLENIFK